MAELTLFGKEIRKRRIDRGETLGDMADALKVSAAFLSAVETGKKNVPGELLEKIIGHFELTGADAHQLRRLALESRSAITIKPNPKTRELAAAFARKFEELDKQQIEEILKVLNKKR